MLPSEDNSAEDDTGGLEPSEPTSALSEEADSDSELSAEEDSGGSAGVSLDASGC